MPAPLPAPLSRPTDSEIEEALIGILGRETYAAYRARVCPRGTFNGLHGLTLFETLAMYVYSTGLGWHESINAGLWSAAPPKPAAVFGAVVDGALVKLPVHAGRAYRGFTPRQNLGSFMEHYRIGTTLRWPGLSSASAEADAVYDRVVMFVIDSKKGRRIGSVSEHPEEKEVLFATNSIFRVEAIDYRAKRTFILMSELDE